MKKQRGKNRSELRTARAAKPAAVLLSSLLVCALAICFFPLHPSDVPGMSSHNENTLFASSSAEPSSEGSGQASSEQRSASHGTDIDAGIDHEPNTVLVSATDESQLDGIRSKLESSGIGSDVSIDSGSLDSGFVTVTYASEIEVEEVSQSLADLGLDAQPDYLYYALDTEEQEGAPLVAQANATNDPSISLQWGLEAVGAYGAWESLEPADASGLGHKTVVATIDSGCNVDHPDLKDNIVGTYDTRTGGTDVSDEQDHGTSVAGIISAKTNNGTGIAGVSKDAGLYIVKVLYRNSDGQFVAKSSDVRKAFTHIMDNKTLGSSKDAHIRVINMSLGRMRTGTLKAEDQLVVDAIDEAYSKHGILTVGAAGNRETTLPYNCYPCDCTDNMVGVINLRRQDDGALERSSSSNYNMPGMKTKQLSAPGTRIYTTRSNGGYIYKEGTSMAAPFVSGVAALVFQANPQLSASQAKEILFSTAEKLTERDFDEETGYGLVNARRAVQKASATKGEQSSNGGGNNGSSSGGSSSTAQPGSSSSQDGLAMHRLYNPNTGEHLYTWDSNEKDTLSRIGWRYEGIGWNSPKTSSTPVHRLYNPYSSDHHYTTDTNERDSLVRLGWRYENVCWYSDDQKRVPLYRQFNPNETIGTHNYTKDKNENDTLVRSGWRAEGIAWYGM